MRMHVLQRSVRLRVSESWRRENMLRRRSRGRVMRSRSALPPDPITALAGWTVRSSLVNHPRSRTTPER